MATFLCSLIDRSLSSICDQTCRLFFNSPPKLDNQDSVVDKTCRYRLDTSTSSIFTLPDGRKLGYAQYGAPNGKTVFYLHGLPGSRLETALFDEYASKVNLRLISIDRPSHGWSSPQSGRKAVDHAKDVERLGEHLQLKEYGVLGISGGGPYALACAATLPKDKLKVVSVVCGLGLPDMSKRDMNWAHYAGFTAGWTYFPRLSQWYLSREATGRLDLTDDQRLALMKKQFLSGKPHPKDMEFFGDEDLLRVVLRSGQEAFAQGFDGMGEDGGVLCADPGFKVEDIRKDLPVQLWYGKHDNFVGLAPGTETKERIGGMAELHVEDETHASISCNCREKFMGELAKVMNA